MEWKQVFTSSVGKKLVMAFTGIFLILFLIVHVGINACIWANDGGKMFNLAAHFMGENVIPRVLEVGLFAGIILHIYQGYLLELQNRTKRGQNNYAVPYSKGSKWYSRSMALLGTLVLLFLILHLYHFWTPSRLGGIGSIHELKTQTYDGKEYHDLYAEMKDVFQAWWVVLIYSLGCISLGYHLAHGFQSAFRTIGVYNNRYNLIITSLGFGFSILVPLAFILMPISFFFGWLN